MYFLSATIRVFILLLSCAVLNAQPLKKVKAQRFIYQFTFQPDTADKTSLLKEDFALDIFDTHSRFISLRLIRLREHEDSLRKAIEARGTIDGMVIRAPKESQAPKFIIYKFPGGTIEVQEKVGKENFAYREDLSALSWQVLDSTTKFAGYHCQWAKARFAGRNWTALFTTEVPLNDGPYKFSGLPGLIVKMWDDQDHALFELLKATNIKDGVKDIPAATLVAKKELSQIRENHFMSGLNLFLPPAQAGQESVGMRSLDGKTITREDVLKRMADMKKRSNNQLEIE